MLLSLLSSLLAGENETEGHKIFINLWGETKAHTNSAKTSADVSFEWTWKMLKEKLVTFVLRLANDESKAVGGKNRRKLFRAHNKVGEGKQKLYGSQKYAYLLGLISLHWTLNEKRAGGGWRSPAKLNTTEHQALKGIFYDNIMTRRTYLMPNMYFAITW